MLPFRLVRIALEAEALRLSHLVRRMAIRVLLACVALALLLGALAFAHVAIWVWLSQSLPTLDVALIFAGADLLLAVVFGVMASRSTPAKVELEALAVRRRALDDAAGSLTLTAMLVRLAREWWPPGR